MTTFQYASKIIEMSVHYLPQQKISLQTEAFFFSSSSGRLITISTNMKRYMGIDPAR